MKVFVRLAFLLLAACGSASAEVGREAVDFVPISSLADLDRALKSADGKPTLVKVRADWNASSAELDKNFRLEALQNLLVDVILLEMDVTDYTDDHREFLSRYSIFGPPHLLFFDKNGMHIVDKDIAGYQTAVGLEKYIREALNIGSSPPTEGR